MVVAMAMTWNVHVAHGNGSLAIRSHRLTSPKPRPVPAVCHNRLKVIW